MFKTWNFLTHCYLSSGEFHAFRLPVPGLWLDIFQKAVAAGLNGISLCIPCKYSLDRLSLYSCNGILQGVYSILLRAYLTSMDGAHCSLTSTQHDRLDYLSSFGQVSTVHLANQPAFLIQLCT